MQLRLVPSRRDDRGVTLLELLMAVVLLAVIMVPLSNALISFLRNTDATNERLAASHDAQIAAAYFAQDVHSMGLHDWTAPPYALLPSTVERNAAADAGNRCRRPAPAGTPDAVIRMSWDDPAAATGVPGKVVVSYVVIVDGNERQLHRLRCDSTGTVLPGQDIIVAHNLASDPVATCRTAALVELPSCGPTVPHSIEMPLSIRVSGSANNILTVTLVGQRRQT